MVYYVLVCILISAALFFKPCFLGLVLYVVVVVVAALFFFGGLHFDTVLDLTHVYLAFHAFFKTRLKINKNSSNPCSYLRHLLENMHASKIRLDQGFCTFYRSSSCLM